MPPDRLFAAKSDILKKLTIFEAGLQLLRISWWWIDDESTKRDNNTAFKANWPNSNEEGSNPNVEKDEGQKEARGILFDDHTLITMIKGLTITMER